MAGNGYCLIADPESNAWQYAVDIHEKLKERSKRFQLGRIDIKRFRDGEIKPKIGRNVRKKDCFFIHDSSKRPADWFLELALINHTLKNSSANEVVDVLPYIRFMRQDRKDESRVPLSSRVVADSIGNYADRVLTIDMHNPSTQGCYGIPVDNLHSFPTVVAYLKRKQPTLLENMVVMSTDAGGAARATAFAKRIGHEDIAIGVKKRPAAGEVGSVKVIGDVAGRDVFIIDDIIDSGNTLVTAANAARAAGAKKVYVYCTHGLFTEGTEKITKACDAIFVGDTIKQTQPGVNAISFVPLFAEAIYRVSSGPSLSALFK